MVSFNNFKNSDKPTLKQLNEIEKWLIEEQENTGHGFYCNWNIIKSAFLKNKFVTISLENEAIGFACWHNSSDITATIDIVEIKPTNRKKGIGKLLISYLFKYLETKNIYVVDLQCAPESSEPVWRKLGFIDFPFSKCRCNWETGNKKLYQILIPSANNIFFNEGNELIELWNDEPYSTQNFKPTWKWEIECIAGTRNLLKPIIHPCHYDWRLRWINKGKVIRDAKVKYLDIQEIYFDEFLFISSLPELEQLKSF